MWLLGDHPVRITRQISMPWITISVSSRAAAIDFFACVLLWTGVQLQHYVLHNVHVCALADMLHKGHSARLLLDKVV